MGYRKDKRSRTRSDSHRKKYHHKKNHKRSYDHDRKKKHSYKSSHKHHKKYYKKYSKSVSSSSSCDSKDRSKDAGHYEYFIGENIADRYIIKKFLGDGTFGRVFEVTSLINGQNYAMKMIRAVERYIESAKVSQSEIQMNWFKDRIINSGINT